MVLPIYVYGAPVLREEADELIENTPELQQFVEDMFDTMHGAKGIGLAAPQVGRSLRLFVVDLTIMNDEDEASTWPDMPMVFINPEIVEESEDESTFEEGCLSIPDLREEVIRPTGVRIQYLDRSFTPQDLEATGMLARVIQHEYDHLDGVLFTDLITPFRRRMLKRRLRNMAKGDVKAEYELALPTEGSTS